MSDDYMKRLVEKARANAIRTEVATIKADRDEWYRKMEWDQLKAQLKDIELELNSYRQALKEGLRSFLEIGAMDTPKMEEKY